jgi:hypothetical protein
MPYASNRDRQTTELELTKAPWPAPPLNLFMTSGFEPGVIDLTWDDPTELAINSRFRLVGVNIYRSFDSEFGPFERVTDTLVGARFWRDRTDNELVEEDVTGQFVLFGDCTASGSNAPRYVFKTQNFPIVKEGSQKVNADSPDDVHVFIDGRPARVLHVYGSTGEIEIDPFVYVDVAKQAWDPSLVPQPQSRVTCVYRFTRKLIRTDLMQRIFYRVTTVGIPIGCNIATASSEDFVETPIEKATATSTMEIEKLDYIWKEAIRRNRWILEQGGERVKIFLQKHAGISCPCIPDDYHGQPISDCHICFGTSFVGGYDGPYDAIVAPDDAERRISQSNIGRTATHNYEVWTGPAPIMSMRDFLVKINGDRYSVSAVRFPQNRGAVLQQHFTIGHIDEKDIRYRVPMSNPTRAVALEFAPSGPEQEASSEITNNPSIPEERQLRGRTKVWENIEY